MSIYVDVSKKFKDFTLCVKFETGDDTLALLGASGCGKSITLGCIAGIIKPDSGKIIVNDRVFFDGEQKINLTPQQRRTGLLFQNYALFPNMTVYENIKIGVRREKNIIPNHNLIDELINKFELTNILHHYPSQISGGQKQRVALARMLVSKPSILLLDEPFSALDTHLKFNLQRHMLSTIKEFDKTVLLVSHDRDEIYRMSDNIAIMKEGKIEQIGTKQQVFISPYTTYAARLTGCKNISDVDIMSDNMLFAKDWGVELSVDEDIENNNIHAVGIRMHDVKVCSNSQLHKYIVELKKNNLVLHHKECNIFKCKIYEQIQNPFSYTLMLKIDGVDMNKLIGVNIQKDKLQDLVNQDLYMILPNKCIITMRSE